MLFLKFLFGDKFGRPKLHVSLPNSRICMQGTAMLLISTLFHPKGWKRLEIKSILKTGDQEHCSPLLH